MEEERQLLERLRQYVKEQEEAKQRSKEIARKSFESWSIDTNSKIGRAYSIDLKWLNKKAGELWDYLFK